MQFRIATWNVNSLRVRLAHVLYWLAADGADLLGLQETKLVDEKFPRGDIEEAGFHVVYAGQPTYNGVAILARKTVFESPANVVINNPLFPDEQVRIIGADLRLIGSPADAPLRFLSVYVPNGAAINTDKYDYKMRWLTALRKYLAQQIALYPELAVVGDYNIAPEDRDVHEPELWRDQVLCSGPERAHFQSLLDLGLKDAFRLHDQPEALFSWWDYRQAAFRRNRGLRIDHLLLSQTLAERCAASGIDPAPRKLDQPSDHAPAWATLQSQK